MFCAKTIKTISAPMSNPGLTDGERLAPRTGVAQKAQSAKDGRKASRPKPAAQSAKSHTGLYRKHSDRTPQEAASKPSGGRTSWKQAWDNFVKKLKDPQGSPNSDPWQDGGPKWGDRGKLFANI